MLANADIALFCASHAPILGQLWGQMHNLKWCSLDVCLLFLSFFFGSTHTHSRTYTQHRHTHAHTHTHAQAHTHTTVRVHTYTAGINHLLTPEIRASPIPMTNAKVMSLLFLIN